MPQLLTVAEVVNLTRLSKPTIYRRIKDGSFPRPVQVGPRAVRFVAQDIEAWLDGLQGKAAE